MITAIIQARMGSTRLPGKVLKKIKDKTLLEILVERLKHSEKIDRIVIATSDNPKDKAIVKLAKKINCPCFIGDEEDVLDRFYKTAEKFRAEIIVRVSGDCPFHDPKLVDEIIIFYLKNKDKFDYVSNVNPPTFPDGFDLWVFPFRTLKRAWQEAKLKSEREHVCPYIWKNKNLFRIGHFESKKDYSGLRLTVDDIADFKFLKKIYESIQQKGKMFHLEDILYFLDKNPDLLKFQSKKLRDEGYLKSIEKDKK